jgi:hypothetical protein
MKYGKIVDESGGMRKETHGSVIAPGRGKATEGV